MSKQRRHFILNNTAKTNDKSTNLRKNDISGISDVVIASVYSEKTSLKKLIMIIFIITSNT